MAPCLLRCTPPGFPTDESGPEKLRRLARLVCSVNHPPVAARLPYMEYALAPLPPDYDAAARDVVSACERTANEAEVAARIETQLVPLLAAHGVAFEPRREVRVVARSARMDSQFGAVVTEYKAKLAGDPAWAAATAQLVGYLADVVPNAQDRDGWVGAVTDGRWIRFVTFEAGQPRPEAPAPLDGPRLRRYVETLVALGRRGLNQGHLVEDFGAVQAPPGGLGRGLASACWAALGQPTAKTGMLHTEWRRLFARSVDHRAAPAAHAEAYREALGLPPGTGDVDAARALFALQTSYAIVVKLVAARVLGELRLEGQAAFRFDALAAASDEALRGFMAELEDGHLLRATGLENLLEGDFFAWYADPGQWTPELARAVRAAIARLAEYEGRAPALRPGGLGDLFRHLYQRSIPATIRHDLGEYYTPRWLAQAVLAEFPPAPGWRGLDPCCGSGTFVVEMVAEALAETEGRPAAERLADVLGRVAGIDLNPLAVLTARVNYFLAIAGLIGEAGLGTCEIPVYLGDAAATPTPCDMAGVPGLAYTLPTAMGPLDVALPLSLARRGAAFGAVMRAVERAIVGGEPDAARHALRGGIGAADLNAAVAEAVDHFVDALAALEAQGWDRIWARIVKNFLATAALAPFDRVAGNPPWVEWKDLPDGYRETIRDACRARGLFSDDGYVGGTDLNVCALIAHGALERWVRPGGWLGFLMPHQMLHVRSSQGLRRWTLPDGTPLGLIKLADWTALRPFEAACRPTTYMIQRGVAGPATVPLTAWRARPGAPARGPGDAWAQVKAGVTATVEAAQAVDADGGPYLIDEPARLPGQLALLGPCAYRGRRATETSPHGVFWVRPVGGLQPNGLQLVEHGLNPRARDGVLPGRALMERDLLFPLLRGADVKSFKAVPGDALVILPHDAATGAKPLPPAAMPPATLDYLAKHRTLLEQRSSFKEYRQGQPFYALWRVGPYSFAPWKVVWPELGELRAAVVSTALTPWGESRMIVPEGKVNLVPCTTEAEAHYLCALLNAPIYKRTYARMSSQIGRPSRLPFAIAAHSPERWTHRALAALSRAAHGGQLDGARREALLDWLALRASR